LQGFIDETIIELYSGKGGPGAVSFRREKYVPKGGPDGGDGGRGGDVIFIVQENLKTLSHLKMQRVFKAKNGAPGEGRKRHGKDGESTLIPVPPGTVLKEPDSNRIIRDLVELKIGETWTFLKGGLGGKGNTHFVGPTRQAPRYAQPGKPGEKALVKVELQTIADIGLVGFPNAGKSSLLDVLTQAHPKIGNYPFTTKIPNLGVLSSGYADMVIADIPGIIEGASKGAGLGIQFLKHISRTTALAFLLDVTEENYTEQFMLLKRELVNFSPSLGEKRAVIIGTKLDLDEGHKRFEELKRTFPNVKVLGVSAFSRIGLEEVKREFFSLIAEEVKG